MSSDEPTDDGVDLARRPFLKTAGAVAGAGILGLGASGGAAAAEGSIDRRFLNWRTVEARKVWERGYRGRRDRTTAMTDSGVDPRHPGLGPWNGATVEVRRNQLVLPTGEATVSKLEGAGGTFTGTVGPGGPPPANQRSTHPFTSPPDASKVEASLSGSPSGPNNNPPDNELLLQKRVDDGWQTVASARTFGSGEAVEAFIEGDQRYRWVVETYINAGFDYEIAYEYFEVDAASLTGAEAREAIFRGSEEAGVDSVLDPAPEDAPKVVGWFDVGGRYGRYDRPRDPVAHGTHVCGIMTGTGQGSVLDDDRTEIHKPRAVLLPGDFIEYEVEAEAGTNVYACAFGDNIEVDIVGPDGRVIHSSPLRMDKTLVDEPTVDERHGPDGLATYTVRVRPWEGDSALENEVDVPEPQKGTPTVGRVNEIAVGTFMQGDGQVGARVSGGGQAVHPGVAPNQSLVGIQGLDAATLGRHSDDFAQLFNLRTVNMSWGPIEGIPFGTAGNSYVGSVRKIAEGGILTVASAGNSTTPANQGGPGMADEAISVVATGPLDGIASYSSGGIGALDEDEPGAYGKPDVTAPGGDIEPDILLSEPESAVQNASILAPGPFVDVPFSNPLPSPHEWIRAPLAGDADTPESEQDIRDYLSIPGTSMSSPFVCGVSTLVAEAMDAEHGDAPGSIELPLPAETGLEDVLRLKQVILATASETAFTAAPYHNSKTTPHQPTYQHGDRDPYEGYGRVNPDAAVDAVTRALVADDASVADTPTIDTGAVGPEETASATVEETVGLGVPVHSRAVAGYLDLDGGEVEVSIAHRRYAGGNKGMAKGAPHLDLFVYDAENPAAAGEPNIVTSAQGRRGEASVSVSGDGTYYVVAKLVNVPGAFNGFDIRSQFDLSLSYTAPALPALSAAGRRADDGSAFTGGQTDEVSVTLTDASIDDGGVDLDPEDTLRVEDVVPAGWRVLWELSDDADRAGSENPGPDSETVVDLGTVDAAALEGDDEVTRTYFVEAPSDAGDSGPSTFGPARAVLTDGADRVSNAEATFGGTDRNLVVGQSTNSP